MQVLVCFSIIAKYTCTIFTAINTETLPQKQENRSMLHFFKMSSSLPYALILLVILCIIVIKSGVNIRSPHGYTDIFHDDISAFFVFIFVFVILHFCVFMFPAAMGLGIREKEKKKKCNSTNIKTAIFHQCRKQTRIILRTHKKDLKPQYTYNQH